MTTEPQRWRKSSRSSANTNCVEVSNLDAVRDSKNPGAVLKVSLVALVSAVKCGKLNR